jgi:uncharacterized protein YbbC (DUF1343 family)
MHAQRWLLIGAVVTSAACRNPPPTSAPTPAGGVRPGISVLMSDSVALVRGKRIALLTNQTGVDEHGVSDIEVLRDSRARDAGVRLVRLFSPEHGIRGTEDRTHIESGIDERSGLPVHSLYTETAIAPPDSLLTDLEALVFDLQDVGTRTWTYVGSMIYAMRAAARRHLPFIVLDRPNPIAGYVDGPVLDSALANANEQSAGRPAKPYALYPFPLRHGMTMGEMARFYNEVLAIGAPLHVVPVSGWKRSAWFDETGLPWVRPSPNLPTLTSALIYPALVAFEGSNVSVGRGTADAFQRFGAPWMNAPEVASLLNGRNPLGVRFVVDSFTAVNPGDGKYAGRRIPGVRIMVTDRNAVRPGHLCAEILWALLRTSRDSLHVVGATFDERFGSPMMRQALFSGEDPDRVVDRGQGAVDDFEAAARRFLLYR